MRDRDSFGEDEGEDGYDEPVQEEVRKETYGDGRKDEQGI